METLRHVPMESADLFSHHVDSYAPDTPSGPDDLRKEDQVNQDRFRKDQNILTISIILLWTVVQLITLIKNLFIYNLLSEPIDYTNLLTKRAIPWVTAIVFIFIINYTSRYFLRLNIKLIYLPLIHFVLALAISFIMYVTCYYGVISLGMSTFQNSNILKYFMVEIDRLFLIYLLISITTTAFYYFNEMKTKEMALLRMENAYRQSRIVSLNNEVNPHMIFNTLNNIYTLINEDLEHAKKMIIDFSTLLRQSLKNKDTIYTTIGFEQLFLTDYINLQNNTKQNQYRIHIEFPEELKNVILPKMLIQPLVENAIKHTSSSPGKPLNIYVTFAKDEMKTVIQVKNKNSSKARKGTKGKPGIGIDNIIRRLEVLYPAQFDFIVDESDEHYMCNISIPYQNSPIETN